MESAPYTCNTSTLDPYVPGVDNPWKQAAVMHLSYGQYIYRISFAGQHYSKSILIR